MDRFHPTDGDVRSCMAATRGASRALRSRVFARILHDLVQLGLRGFDVFPLARAHGLKRTPSEVEERRERLGVELTRRERRASQCRAEIDAVGVERRDAKQTHRRRSDIDERHGIGNRPPVGNPAPERISGTRSVVS